MSGDLQQRFLDLARRHIDGGTFPGIVLRIERDGKPVVNFAAGSTGLGEYEKPLSEDAVYDLASLTKPLASTSSFLAVCEAERISLDSRAGSFIPELRPETGNLSLIQLMTHTGGLPPVPEIFRLFKSDSDIDEEMALEHLFSLTPVSPQGTVVYSCTGYILLTQILNRITGRSLSELFRELFTEPMGIDDLIFNPEGSPKKRCVPTEYCRWRNRMCLGEVHDENSLCLGGEGGNAGLFGTAEAVSKLAELFRCEGSHNGRQYLSPETVSLMTSRQSESREPARALGFLTQSGESFAGGGFSETAFGHTGFTGTSLWMDNELGIKVTALTNRVHPGRDLTAEKIRLFRKELHGLLLSAIC